jgi:ribonuclease VapC
LNAILDASAVLAVLRREPGWDVVEKVITESVVSAINAGEVVQRQLRLGISRATTERLMAELELPILPVDPSLAMDAAELRHAIPRAGLSQADCICLALAKRLNVTAMTADRAWAGIADEVGVAVRVIR